MDSELTARPNGTLPHFGPPVKPSQAHGIRTVAEDTSLDRESIYRTLSSRGNPRLASLRPVLSRLGLQLSVQVRTLARP